MRKVIKATTLAGLILVALAAPAPARAQDGGYAASPESYYPRLQFGASFLPMSAGKFTSTPGGMTTTAEAAFAYGVSVSGNYTLLPGLSVGLAPQVVLNVKAKDDPAAAAKEIDVMARVAGPARRRPCRARIAGYAWPGCRKCAI